MTLLFTAIISFLLGALTCWLLYKMAIAPRFVEKNAYEALRKEMHEQILRYTAELSRLQAEVKFKEEHIQTLSAQFRDMGTNFETQFRSLAQHILEEKAAKISLQQNDGLKAILDPLKEQIRTFRDDYELKRMKESEERVSLREQVKQMMELNKNLSAQAESLTAALRGNVKQQGNWGEMILESILQHAGLQKGVQYFTQEQTTNADGRLIQPDVIVRYPGDRAIVIDAKVSLVHFEQYNLASDKAAQDAAVKAVVRSFKNHIDGLSGKSYQDIGNALDFIMMFVPVEGAYLTAVQNDPTLWQYAYSKKILLISPTNLIAAMKLVADMWQREHINNEAHRIAERAGKLYDKLVLFVENFEKVGVQLSKAQDCWQDAQRQLVTGKGNAISQAEQMKAFSTKTSRSLPANLVTEALLNEPD